MLYVYDYGDNWRHDVVLEKVLPAAGMVHPVCLAGERHSPPEDVGGVSGYEEFLEVIFEPGHEEYEHYVRWAEGPSPLNRSVGRFQPEEFSIMAVNDALSRSDGQALRNGRIGRRHHGMDSNMGLQFPPGQRPAWLNERGAFLPEKLPLTRRWRGPSAATSANAVRRCAF